MKEKSKDKQKSKMKWGIVCVLMSIFVALLIGVKTGKVLIWDNNIYQIIRQNQNETLTKILTIITHIGGPIGIASILAFSVIFCVCRKKEKYGVAITLNVIITTILYFTLKNIIQRPRPPVGERLVSERGFSFPSGHTTNNIALYGFFIYLVFTNVKDKKLKSILCTILGIMPILIGFSRAYLRVHYVSDVIAGICLGISCVIIFTECIFKKMIKKENEE